MGYRTYIGKINKIEYDEIKDLSRKELNKLFELDDDDFVSHHELIKELYEFGKYTEFDDQKFFKPFFNDNEQQDLINEDHDFWVVDKEYLKHIIEHYKSKIVAYYNDMVTPFWGSEMGDAEEFIKSMEMDYSKPEKERHSLDFSKITPEQTTKLWETLCHVRTMRSEWTYLTPFDLDKGDEICRSWKYEYNIFELVRIYKTFDWENDVMVYYGY